MSDNDYVSREAVFKALFGLLVDSGWYERARNAIDRIPAVEPPMSAVEFMKLRSRICHEQYINRQSDDDWLCDGCVLKACCSPADSECCEAEAVAIIEEWAREHPEERSEE